ncbi:MAG: type II toxin-antitoxin system Phd/YefM family antitoxin [Treponema sp.]|nr:type II toxin-antitoxin system Phd/YefM family antitoxin [Treponema sp.]
MVAPLHDVKSRFSEYVELAQNGETIAVTKHGKVAVIIISEDSLKEYKPPKKSFMENWREWRAQCEAEDIEFFDDVAKNIENLRKIPGTPIRNLFEDEEE